MLFVSEKTGSLRARKLNICENTNIMTKNRKYAYKIEQKGSTWNAQITRQITSKKVVVSKEKNDFVSETDATEWAEQQLLAFTTTLSTSNQRHGEQRKHSEEDRQLRSARRSEKTQQAKQKETDRKKELTSSAPEDSEITNDADYISDQSS